LPEDNSVMLKPSVQVHNLDGLFVAEFWDCWRLDPAPVQDLRREFDKHLAKKGRPDLVVDMLGVGFAGSSASGGFVALQKTARQAGGRMIYCNIDPTVREVFRVSKLESLYTFSKDRASAMTDVLNPAPAPLAGSSEHDLSSLAPPKPRPSAIGGDRLRRRKTEG